MTPNRSNDIKAALVFDNRRDEWLTAREAAGYLKLPLGSLMNMTSNGQLPYYKLGGRNRYLKSELDRTLLAQRKGSVI